MWSRIHIFPYQTGPTHNKRKKGILLWQTNLWLQSSSAFPNYLSQCPHSRIVLHVKALKASLMRRYLCQTVVCTVFEIWHNYCSVQSSGSFHKNKFKCIQHLHCTEEKQLSFIIRMDSQDACLILGTKKSKSLLYHKFWAWFQLTDFWHKCWTCKDT